MSRKDIFATLRDRYNVNHEIMVITKLFDSEVISFYSSYAHNRTFQNISLEKFVDRHLFKAWQSRLSCVNCKDMRECLEIDTRQNSGELSDVVLCLEYYMNILQLFLKKSKSVGFDFQFSNYFTILIENIEILLNHINHETLEIKGEEKVLIVPKNPAGTAAAEVSTKPTGIAILKYHHALLRGNLEEKRTLLVTIAREYEEVLRNPPKGCEVLFDKTEGLVNCLHIRHNNQEGKYAKYLPENLEAWYDELYQMLLLCILENDNVTRMDKVQGLFDTFKK